MDKKGRNISKEEIPGRRCSKPGCMYGPAQGFKGRSIELWVLNRRVLNFCVRRIPRRDSVRVQRRLLGQQTKHVAVLFSKARAKRSGVRSMSSDSRGVVYFACVSGRSCLLERDQYRNESRLVGACPTLETACCGVLLRTA